MAVIIRGTTPTIKIAFTQIDTSSIAVAYLCFKKGNTTIVEKSLAEATVQPGYLSWKLSQEESLLLKANQTIQVMCDWRLADGTRGRSAILTSEVDPTGKNEVI